jgi:hypothetical protein
MGQSWINQTSGEFGHTSHFEITINSGEAVRISDALKTNPQHMVSVFIRTNTSFAGTVALQVSNQGFDRANTANGIWINALNGGAIAASTPFANLGSCITALRIDATSMSAGSITVSVCFSKSN